MDADLSNIIGHKLFNYVRSVLYVRFVQEETCRRIGGSA